MSEGTFLYFAYGSNMFTPWLCQPARCPSARALGVAELRGHELRWDKASKKDGSGKCDIPNSPNASVFGVLYTIAAGEKSALDRAEAPIDLIRATHPVIIVDEPQSVDGGLQGSGKQALQAMHPLCTLRYSATHADKHHMVYRLDAVDAYPTMKQLLSSSLGTDGPRVIFATR